MSKSSKISILIPIKRNSQRVPAKNFRIFGDVPLWEHTIRKLGNFQVFVDTDDYELLDNLKKYDNVVGYIRDPGLVGDKTSVCDLIRNWIERHNPVGDLFQIHVTSPFLNSGTIEKASRYLETYDSVVSCNQYKSRFWFGEKPVNHDPENLIQTQDLFPVLEENSLFYGFKKSVGSEGKRIGKNPFFFVSQKEESLDIDTESDWDECVKILNSNKNKERQK